ncbi:cation:proton antiporter subunit C [Hyphomonas sp.]|jgi:multicomponent Na+:H+ antiporter subunit C|uniref:cation:proton antiporter subunit C n=1 Tax=Hyphomonas sp. TaxID=87 RepID=UPI0032D8CBAA
MLLFILERANYWAVIGLMMIGLYITFASGNLIKRLVGLSLFQTSICLFYVTLGIVAGGTAPILMDPDTSGGHGGGHGEEAPHAAIDAVLTAASGGDRVADLVHTYSNPLPHVLMLTAIVVGVATLSVGLALIVRIREAYGTIEADEVREIDMQTAIAQEAEQEAAEKEALA